MMADLTVEAILLASSDPLDEADVALLDADVWGDGPTWLDPLEADADCGQDDDDDGAGACADGVDGAEGCEPGGPGEQHE